jgi:hypothetical protein
MGAKVQTNLVVKKKRRIEPKAADIFRAEMVNGISLFGRVACIPISMPLVGVPAMLLYFFKPGAPFLTTDNLLIPPKLVMTTLLNLGYFEVVETRPFGPGERFTRHCLHDGMKHYFSEDGSPIASPFEPTILSALSTIPTIDRALSRALGIPLAMPPFGEGPAAGGQERPVVAASVSVTADEIALFWKAMESARKSASGACEQLVAALGSKLSRASRASVESFARVQAHLMARANTWDLWGAAFILNGGCSDDGFEYFRAWLIAQGKETFDAAVDSPDSLIAVAHADEEHECEELLYIASRVFEERFETPLDSAKSSGEPKGQPWKEEELPTRFPALWARFRRAT